MKKINVLLSAFILFVGMSACQSNNDKTVATQSDTTITNRSFIAFDTKQNETILSVKLHTGEGETMVNLYQQNPITQLVTKDKKPLKALEFDETVIDSIRQDTAIHGLRVYLGKEPKAANGDGGLYTLVAVPYDKNGYNLDNLAFEWHNPCPPCTTKPQREPREGSITNQDPNDYGNSITTFFQSQEQVDSLKNANK